MNVDSFFFLRPLWLLLLIPIVVLLWHLLQGNRTRVSTPWQRLVDPHLLQYLVVQSDSGNARRWHATLHIAVLGAALLAATLALAGPTWQRNRLPTYKARIPVVMVLSLAQSMNATDLSPNRLTRAEHKVRDILKRSKGGDLALVVYSDQPFAATPLTSDAKVIRDMLPELSTSLMPVLGNRLDLAIEQAATLLTQAGARQGQILVLADDAGEHPELGIKAAAKAADDGYRISVLGVGTDAGAALQTASGKTITDRAGQGYTTRLAAAELTEIAIAGEGHFALLTPDASDLDTLLADTPATGISTPQLEPALHADAWNDMGYWLLIIPLLLAPLAFRKNLLLSALPVLLALNLSVGTPDVQAAESQPAQNSNNTMMQAGTAASLDNTSDWSTQWNKLWRTPDQRAVQDFQADDFEEAAQTFSNPDWKASALYRDGQFEQAASLYASDATTFNNQYNHGNALAMGGQFKQALAAYDKALELQPGNEDAAFNRNLVAKLLEQQKQEQQEQHQEAGDDQPQDQQQQASSEQPQSQQKQAGGDQPQEKQQQAGGEQTQEQQQEAGSDQAQDDNQQPSQSAQTADGKNAFQKAMDKLLSGNGNAEDTGDADKPVDKDQPIAAGGYSEQDQATEQQLRAVPDDPSGLLRARIRQHYAQQRADRG